MKPLAFMAAAAGLFVLSTPALAQTAPAPAPAPAPSFRPMTDIGANMPNSTGAANMADYSRGESFRRNMSDRQRAAVQNASPGRLSRAERVAGLINEGDCTGAYALALDARDRRLASRVAEVCDIEE